MSTRTEPQIVDVDMDALRDRRLACGLSQQQLATEAACSIAMVRHLEQGLRPARSDVVPRIEAVLAAHEARA